MPTCTMRTSVITRRAFFSESSAASTAPLAESHIAGDAGVALRPHDAMQHVPLCRRQTRVGLVAFKAFGDHHQALPVNLLRQQRIFFN